MPETPDDEALRLATLRALNVLDTPPEERFDRLTRLARRMFQAPMAGIGLIDADRLWFKSSMGPLPRDLPRSDAFCAHAIASGAALVVPDAHTDARFADHPLVTGEPKVRFCAAQPFVAPNGCRLGALLLFDHEPRQLDAELRDVLRDLGAMVERELWVMPPNTLDALTGITNKRGFLTLAQRCLSQCIRQGHPAALALFTLAESPFDRQGSAPADTELAVTTFADTMQRSFRESDVFARLNDDEFALLLSHVDADGAVRCVARFCRQIEAENADMPADNPLRFSWHVTAFDPSRHNTVDALLNEARKSLLHRRRAG